MSMPSGGSGAPGHGGFTAFSPGAHSGVDPDADAHVAEGSIDTRARNALTLGLLSLVLNVLTGIPAILVGRHALAHIAAADGALKGRWAAWTGIALGCLSVVAFVGVVIYLNQHP
ncbi:hypothetical protein [Nocardioides cynanchi]|uniref:hypothetical protein n=1 Tax=Nocardioides cynanchi TaxID=2558918 RepID=UPI001244D258|nr:hypothetical protein [Nocardioides cynanchi]